MYIVDLDFFFFVFANHYQRLVLTSCVSNVVHQRRVLNSHVSDEPHQRHVLTRRVSDVGHQRRVLTSLCCGHITDVEIRVCDVLLSQTQIYRCEIFVSVMRFKKSL